MGESGRRVLLTGATGFVGRALRPSLEAEGFVVRCASRHPARAAASDPQAEWVELDLDRPRTLAPALRGVDVAFHLIHGMSEGHGYAEREAQGARAFRDAAQAEGVGRIVYLGGVDPAGKPSKHLASRLETGRILRAGSVPTLEIRASMIAGPGSISWQMVRDLAARLPVMILPAWLKYGSWPVYIDDVCAALVRAVDVPLPDGSQWFDAPGPERTTHGDLIRRVAARMDRHPPAVPVPVFSPRLSSYWVALVTRADLNVAKELVQGLGSDLDPSGPEIWAHMAGFRRTGLDEMIDRCLAADASGVEKPQDLWGLVERRLR